MTVELDDQIPIACPRLLLLLSPILQQPNPFAIAHAVSCCEMAKTADANCNALFFYSA